MADSQSHGQGRDEIGVSSGTDQPCAGAGTDLPATRYRMTPAGLEPATSGLGMPSGPLTGGHDSDNPAQIGAFPAPPESRLSVWFCPLSQRRVKERGEALPTFCEAERSASTGSASLPGSQRLRTAGGWESGPGACREKWPPTGRTGGQKRIVVVRGACLERALTHTRTPRLIATSRPYVLLQTRAQSSN